MVEIEINVGGAVLRRMKLLDGHQKGGTACSLVVTTFRSVHDGLALTPNDNSSIFGLNSG